VRQAPYARWDEESDALFVRVRDGRIALTVEGNDGRNLDMDESGKVVGVEILGVSNGFALDDLAEQHGFEDALARVQGTLPTQFYKHSG
jgi:uncharacterized protein YuzE